MNEEDALELDRLDPLTELASQFHRPVDGSGRPLAYLCGHSLGLQPATVSDRVAEVLDRWAEAGVEGHFGEGDSWYRYDEPISEALEPIVGAQPGSVAVMGSLTTDLHLLLASFFDPVGPRRSILIEAGAFPSDRYAVQTHLRWHGLDPADHLIEWEPAASGTLELVDLAALLDLRGHEIAVALIGGVNFGSGQALDLGAVTALLHGHDVLAGFDLAHAAGNIEIDLAGSGADFAAWCSYKYLNAGPGAPAAIYVAPRHGGDPDRLRLGGWWGNDPDTRFAMDTERDFCPASGAAGWKQSNPPILSLAPLGASLALFGAAGMAALAERSARLTTALESSIRAIPGVEVVTPAAGHRGAQLSVRVARAGPIAADMREAGVVADVRPPALLRLAPVPLYNSFHDVWRAGRALESAVRRSG